MDCEYFLAHLNIFKSNVQIMLERYTKKQASLNIQYDGMLTTRQYSRGGLTLHRGYYCPNPVIDMVVGNVSRGRLIKDSAASNLPDYAYYFDQWNTLQFYEKRSEYHKKPTMHYIIRENELEWDFCYDESGNVNQLYMTLYEGQHVIADIYFSCHQTTLTASNLYEAWTFDYLDSILHSSEFFSGVLGSNPVRSPLMNQDCAGQIDCLNRMKYVFHRDPMGEIFEYEFLRYRNHEYRSSGTWNCTRKA